MCIIAANTPLTRGREWWPRKAFLLNGCCQRRKEASCLDMAVRNYVGPKASSLLCSGFTDGGEGRKLPELDTQGFITVK